MRIYINTYSQHLYSSARILQPDWNLWMSIPEGRLLIGMKQTISLAGRLRWKQISRTMRVIKEECYLTELFQAFISHILGLLLQPKSPIFIISSPATMSFCTFRNCSLNYCKLIVFSLSFCNPTCYLWSDYFFYSLLYSCHSFTQNGHCVSTAILSINQSMWRKQSQ